MEKKSLWRVAACGRFPPSRPSAASFRLPAAAPLPGPLPSSSVVGVVVCGGPFVRPSGGRSAAGVASFVVGRRGRRLRPRPLRCGLASGPSFLLLCPAAPAPPFGLSSVAPLPPCLRPLLPPPLSSGPGSAVRLLSASECRSVGKRPQADDYKYKSAIYICNHWLAMVGL